MKIYCAKTTKSITSRAAAKKYIIQGLRAVNCIVNDKTCTLENTRDHCSLRFQLPNGEMTTATFWYEYKKTEEYTDKPGTTLSNWNSDWNVDTDGKVYDSDGNFVGTAIVRTRTTKNKKRAYFDYNLAGIRVDSGDVLVDHLISSKQFQDAVDSLSKRNITIRSSCYVPTL